MNYRGPGRQSLLAVALTVLVFTVVAPHSVALAQPVDEVDITVHLDAIASRDEAPSGDVTIEFTEASTRVPVISYTVDVAAEEQSFQVTVPATESRSGWFASARSEGWWSSTAYIAPDEREVSLTLVPEGVVRFAIDGTDRGVDLLRTGQVWIAGQIGSRGVRLERGLYGGPCEVDREPDRREVLIACPFARDETVDLRVRLGPFLPVLSSEVTVTADTDLGLIEPVRGAAVTGSVVGDDGASRRFSLGQRNAPLTFGWSAWTDPGGIFTFEGLSPGTYELRLAGSDGDSWPVRIESLNDRIDLGQLVSATGNRLAVSFVAPIVLEIDNLRPALYAATLHTNGDVKQRGRRFENWERGEDDSFIWRGLPEGDYQLWVEDNRGNRWHREVVRSYGWDHFFVELNAIPLVGRIKRGGEPLENVLVWFGGLFDVERNAFRTREEGRFAGLLPRDGHWFVHVTPAPDCDPCEGPWEAGGWGDFDDSEINGAGLFEIEPDSDGIARVNIELPGSVVSGRVVRPDFETGSLEPVDRAYVWVSAVGEVAGESYDYRQPGSWRRKTDASGTFEITGLPEWEYTISADGSVGGRELKSQPLRLSVAEDDRIEDLELRLEDRRPVTVIVRSGGVPVLGAQVFFLYPPGTARVEGGAYTRGAGEATDYVSLEAEFVDVVVRAEGFGMNGWRFDVRDGAPVEIHLSADRGSLRVPAGWDARLEAPGGASIRMGSLLGNNNRGHVLTDGDEYVVTDLAPGTYSYCPEKGACSTVDVVPWAETRVRE